MASYCFFPYYQVKCLRLRWLLWAKTMTSSKQLLVLLLALFLSSSLVFTLSGSVQGVANVGAWQMELARRMASKVKHCCLTFQVLRVMKSRRGRSFAPTLILIDRRYFKEIWIFSFSVVNCPFLTMWCFGSLSPVSYYFIYYFCSIICIKCWY